MATKLEGVKIGGSDVFISENGSQFFLDVAGGKRLTAVSLPALRSKHERWKHFLERAAREQTNSEPVPMIEFNPHRFRGGEKPRRVWAVGIELKKRRRTDSWLSEALVVRYDNLDTPDVTLPCDYVCRDFLPWSEEMWALVNDLHERREALFSDLDAVGKRQSDGVVMFKAGEKKNE